jgi:hypothetical protein
MVAGAEHNFDGAARQSRRGLWYGVVTILFVGLTVIFLPAARWFLAISIPIGLLFAVVLYFWNKRPVKLDEKSNKRPLGLE